MKEISSSQTKTLAITCILYKVLSNGPSYGYELIKEIKKTTSGVIDPEEGYLYPLLKKMVSKGYLTTEWSSDDEYAPVRRKIYHLTAEGKKQHEDILLDLDRIQNWIK